MGDTDFELLEDRVPDGDQKVIDQRDIARFVSRRGKRGAARPLPECYAPRYGSVEIGRRRDILVSGTTLTVPLQPV